MNASNNHQGPDKAQREEISKKLQFFASVLGENINMNASESCGLMHLLYELADEIFPEGSEV